MLRIGRLLGTKIRPVPSGVFSKHLQQYNTPGRPDIVVWSEKAKKVILTELTVGDESNFIDQVVRNEAR